MTLAPTSSRGAGGSGTVTSVTAGDTSITIGGTATDPTVATGDLLAITAAHNTSSVWGNNTKRIAALGASSAASDAARYDATLKGIATTAGDIDYATGANAIARLGIGATSRMVLKAISSAPAWELPDLMQLADSTAGGNVASFDLTSIPGTFAHLLLFCKLRSDFATVTDNCNVRVNGDSSSIYDEVHIQTVNTTNTGVIDGSPSSAFQEIRVAGANATASVFGNSFILILDYAATNRRGFLFGSGAITTEGTTSTYQRFTGYGSYRGAAAITQVTLTSGNGGNFVAGSRVTLYGLR